MKGGEASGPMVSNVNSNDCVWNFNNFDTSVRLQYDEKVAHPEK
jgi:hypothetical protein